MIFISEIWDTVKISLCSTINPRCLNTKLTIAKGERKPCYLTSKDYYPNTITPQTSLRIGLLHS